MDDIEPNGEINLNNSKAKLFLRCDMELVKLKISKNTKSELHKLLSPPEIPKLDLLKITETD